MVQILHPMVQILHPWVHLLQGRVQELHPESVILLNQSMNLLLVDQLALITLNSRRPIGWIIKNPRSLSRYAAGNGDGADPDGYP